MAALLQERNNDQVLRISLVPQTIVGSVQLSCFLANAEIDSVCVLLAEINAPSLESASEIWACWDWNEADLTNSDLTDFFNRVLDHLNPEKPLWIQLLPPRGELGLIPWERIIGPFLHQTPLIRWPHRLSRPMSFARRQREIVICSSTPRAKAPFSVTEFVKGFIGDTLQNQWEGTAQTRFHLFFEQQDVAELRDSLADFSSAQVVIYDNNAAIEFETPVRKRRVDKMPKNQNPWLRWIENQLPTSQVDLIQFIAHGYLAGGRGSLAFAESPTINQDEYWSRFVGALELVPFLNRIGAEAIALGSPPSNFSDTALFGLANEIAEQRPGPVIVHECKQRDEIKDFQTSCEVLFRVTNARPVVKNERAFCRPFSLASE